MISHDAFFPIIDGMIVDLKSLISIKHSCVSTSCNISQCCCSYYEVIINEIELFNIVNVISYASRFSHILKIKNGFDNVFEDEGKNIYSIDKNGKGICVFGYKSKERKVLCSLHKAAVDLKVPVNFVKPLVCILWPLALFESDPFILSVQEDVLIFPCNQRRTSSAFNIDSGIAQNIEMAFGSSFLSKIRKKIEGLNYSI